MEDDATRRCALPGCEALIVDSPGRPERRYCTAAHRAAARQTRRASMRPEHLRPEQQERLTATLPWLREPDEPVSAAAPALRPVVVAAPSAVRVRRRASVRRTGTARHHRTIAVLGAAGILVGGYAITAAQSTAPLRHTQPVATSEQDWAARAQITISSLDQQLSTITRAQDMWNHSPNHADTPPPAPVRALQDRRALLERRRAALRSQLDSYGSLGTMRDALAASDHDLDDVQQVLDEVPAAAPRSPEQTQAIATLQEQLDMRQRQRDARRAELAGAEDNVASAVRVPLPDDGQQTAVLTEGVMEMAEGNPVAPAPRPSSPQARPEAVEPREEAAHERQDTATSGPPDPRGPREETFREPAPKPPARSWGHRGPIEVLAGVLHGPSPQSTHGWGHGPAPSTSPAVESPLAEPSDGVFGGVESHLPLISGLFDLVVADHGGGQDSGPDAGDGRATGGRHGDGDDGDVHGSGVQDSGVHAGGGHAGGGHAGGGHADGGHDSDGQDGSGQDGSGRHDGGGDGSGAGDAHDLGAAPDGLIDGSRSVGGIVATAAVAFTGRSGHDAGSTARVGLEQPGREVPVRPVTENAASRFAGRPAAGHAVGDGIPATGRPGPTAPRSGSASSTARAGGPTPSGGGSAAVASSSAHVKASGSVHDAGGRATRPASSPARSAPSAGHARNTETASGKRSSITSPVRPHGRSPAAGSPPAHAGAAAVHTDSGGSSGDNSDRARVGKASAGSAHRESTSKASAGGPAHRGSGGKASADGSHRESGGKTSTDGSHRESGGKTSTDGSAHRESSGKAGPASRSDSPTSSDHTSSKHTSSKHTTSTHKS